jgi:hypothetical protein
VLLVFYLAINEENQISLQDSCSTKHNVENYKHIHQLKALDFSDYINMSTLTHRIQKLEEIYRLLRTNHLI